MLLRDTVQSWVRGPIVFTEAKATKTLENKAEKLTSTSTLQGNIRRFFRGSSETRYEKLSFLMRTKNGSKTNYIDITNR